MLEGSLYLQHGLDAHLQHSAEFCPSSVYDEIRRGMYWSDVLRYMHSRRDSRYDVSQNKPLTLKYASIVPLAFHTHVPVITNKCEKLKRYKTFKRITVSYLKVILLL